MGTQRDAFIDLMEIATKADTLPENTLPSALLQAAEMIRTLRIVAESGVTLWPIDAEALVDPLGG